MRVKKVNRYYCEYCKKSGCSAYHISRHEKACTLNPNRICAMCKYSESEQAPMPELINALSPLVIIKAAMPEYDLWSYEFENEKEAIDKLRDAAGGCPACMLAALRTLDCPTAALTQFTYQTEKDAFWAAYNEDQRQKDYQGWHY